MTTLNRQEWGPNSSEALLQMYEEKVQWLQNRLVHATGEEKRSFEQVLQALKPALDKMKAQIETPDELTDVKDDLEIDNHLLKKLDNLDLDQVDIEFILASDVRLFLDEYVVSQLKVDKTRIQFADSIKSVLGKKDVEIEAEAVSEWQAHTHEIEEEIHSLRLEGKPGPTGLGLIPHLESELASGKEKWIKRRIAIKKLDKSKNIKLLHQDNDADMMNKLKQAFEEARKIRLDKIYNYIETRAHMVRGQFELLQRQSKETGKPAREVLHELTENIREAELLYLQRSITDPTELKNIAQSFVKAQQTLKSIALESKEDERTRADIEKNVKNKYARLQESLLLLGGMDPQTLAQANGETYPLQADVVNGQPLQKIHDKKLAAIAALQGKDPEMAQQMEALEEAVKNLSQVELVDLDQLNRDLETVTRKVADKLDTQKAGNAIAALERANTPEALEQVLLTELGDKHLRFTTEDEFLTHYKKYTQKGDMVFYERGDEWAIIMNKEALYKPGADLNFLKKQIKHELLHLEFEKNNERKDKIRNAFVVANPAQWNEIKTAFLAMVAENSKAAPTDAGWRDDDILSEIYAMQDELGNEWREPRTAKNKLNNLLLAAGAATKLKNTTSHLEDYKNNVTPPGTYRGYEGADEDRGAQIEKGKIIEQVEGSYENFKDRIEANQRRLEELEKTPQLASLSGAEDLVEAMITYNKNTHDLNDELKAGGDPDVLKAAMNARIEKIGNDIGDITAALTDVAKQEDNVSMGFLRRSWNNTKMISLAGFVQMGTDVKEFFARALKRRTADQAAALGVAFFSGTSVGREAKARALQAEADEVGEWEKRYRNMDPWQLLSELNGMANGPLPPNKDQLKAIMRLLAEKGRINWQHEDLWKVLNMLQTSSYFPLGDPTLLRDPVLLRERMLRAFGEMYDFDEFPSLERKNEDSYEGGKKQFDKTHDRTPTKMTERMDELLRIQHTGGKVDPVLYESLIENCMLQGRSYGENVFFHLIAGMASGILSPDRGLVLTRNNNQWPPLDWFTTLKPPFTTEDYKRLCLENFKDAYQNGSLSGKGGAAFKNWFWTTIQTNKAVKQRAQKSVNVRNWDHDWGRTIVALGTPETVQRFFAGRSGQKETQTTAVGNAIAGMTQLLEENCRNQTHADRSEFARIAGILAMTEGILNGSYKGDDATYTRATPEINNEKPREGSVGHHGDLSVNGHRRINVGFLAQVDPVFFGALEKAGELKNREAKQQAGRDLVAILHNRYPILREEFQGEMDVDQVFERIGRITEVMFSQEHMSDARFKQILSAFTPK